MNVVYKTKLYSGDGQTFLRPFLLHIPVCTSDTDSQATETVDVQYTYAQYATTAAPSMFAAVNAKGFMKVKADQNTSFIGISAGAAGAPFVGFNNVISLNLLFNNTPAVGSSVRWVFNNENYLKMDITNVVSDYRFQMRWRFYTKNDTLIATVYTMGTRVTSNHTNLSPFPFALPNEQGVYTNTKIRYYGSVNAYNSQQSMEFSGYRASWDGSGGAASAAIFTDYKYPGTFPGNLDIKNWLEGIEPFDQDDPYSEISDSTPSGPAEGTGIPENDPVDIPDLPTVSAIDTGFVSLFNPTLSQVKSLSDYMWTNSLFDINTFKKIFENPMDCILGFNIVPVDVPSGANANVCVGNLITDIQMLTATSQWVEVNCGSLDVGLPYGNYLDYSPNTKYSIYLPYIGMKELSTDDVAGKTLTLKYHVDVLSCACIAYLKCGDHVLYQFTGSCGYSIPVTGNDFAQMIGSIIDIGLSVGGAVAGGNGIGAVGSIAKDVMGLKPDIHRSGSIGSSAGLMGLQIPFLIIEIPNACKPKKQYHYLGYPSFVTVTLSDISGFASFESIILDGIPCTDAEREIILSMCKGGIYL